MSSFDVSEIFPSAYVLMSFVSDYGALLYSLGAFSCCGEKAAVQQTIICESRKEFARRPPPEDE